MFTRPKKRIYLDVAASAPTTTLAMKEYLKVLALTGNPSSLHHEGVLAKKALEDARVGLARLAQVRAHNVLFTSGATEANTLALVGYVEQKRKEGHLPENMHVLYHPGSHSSITQNIEALRGLGVQVESLALTEGIPDLERIPEQIRSSTILVALELVSGETGTVFDTRDIRRILDRATVTSKKHIRLHVDASQAPRTHSFALSKCGADSLALDAQKVGGVRGIGALLFAGEPDVVPIMHGGPQERGLRPGTENPALACAFVTALEECREHRESFTKSATEKRTACLDELRSTRDMVVNESKDQAPHILNISFLGRDTDYLLFLLDAKGFAVSTKSACESDREGSRMVASMSSDEERARSTLRISWDETTTRKDLIALAHTLTECVGFLDKNAIY